MRREGFIVSLLNVKVVQLTQKNCKELANFFKDVEEHPSRETKYWMLSYIFQYFSVVLDAPLHFSGNGQAFTSLSGLLNTLHLILELLTLSFGQNLNSNLLTLYSLGGRYKK